MGSTQDCDNALFSLKIAHLNVRSIIAHFADVKDVLIANNFDIFGVTETWLNESISSENLKIDGFNFIRCDRGRRGGGVGVYVRSSLNYTVLKYVGETEQVWLNLRFGRVRAAFSVVYKPPTYDCKSFLDSFENTVTEIIPNVDYIFSVGDFNVNLLNNDNSEAQLVTTFFEGLGLKQIINEPTRTTMLSATLLDYILTSNSDLINDSGVLAVPQVSDHDLVYCSINLKHKKPGPIFKTSRDFKNFNYDSFKSNLLSIPWNNVYDIDNIEDKVKFLSDNIIVLLDIHAPFKTYKISKKYAPWRTNTITSMTDTRNKALSKFKKSKSMADWETYKTLRNTVTAAVRKEKKVYYDRYFNNNINQKNVWAGVRTMGIIDKKNSDLPSNLSNVTDINDHFLQSVPDIPPDQDLISFYSSRDNSSIPRAFSFTPITELQVLEIIKSIKSKAVGYDGINIATIHLCVPHILPHITHIINYCLKYSVFPDQWKKALVIPLPKIPNPISLNNIRPISILPTFSKILERVINMQLQKHLCNNGIIPVTQSGYKAGHSCTTALLHITDDIFTAIDKGKLTLLTLLDYSKAFDTLNHQIFNAILKFIGMSENAHKLLSCYLQHRAQAVTYNGATSSFLKVEKGIPQGSILGPIFFSIYISQFTRFQLSCSQHYYADDAQIYISFFPDESTQAVTALNFDLNSIFEVSSKHCLQLNASKSAIILFGRKGDRDRFLLNNHSVFINNEKITFYNSVKNLGMLVDKDLRFTKHISTCLQKAYLMLRFIYQNRQHLSRQHKIMLCESLVLSKLNYGDAVYGPCLNSVDIFRIQKLQNSCLRLIFGIRKFDRISHTLHTAKWLNMKNRRFLHSAALFSKIIANKMPPYLFNKITYRSDVHNINIRFKGNLTPPMHATEIFKRSFSFNIVCCFNNLPQNIRNAFNIRRFKTLLFKRLLAEQNGQ